MLFDQGFNGRWQFKNGIGEWLVTDGLVRESLAVIAGARRVFRRHQRAAEVSVVVKQHDPGRLRDIVFEAVTDQQSGLDVVELVVVLAPIGGAVQPVAAMALEIRHPCEFQLTEVVRLMQSILQIGVATDGLERSVFVDFSALGSHGPGHFAIESGDGFCAVRARDFEQYFEGLGLINKRSFTFHACSFHVASDGHGLDLLDRLHSTEDLFVAIEDLRSGCELRFRGQSARWNQENYDKNLQETHTNWTRSLA